MKEGKTMVRKTTKFKRKGRRKEKKGQMGREEGKIRRKMAAGKQGKKAES